MDLRKVKWGILGTSYISEVMAQAIQASTISELVAIGSRSSISGSAFVKKFSIAKHYLDYRTLLDDTDIDAVYIGLPNHLHHEWVIRCARAGKHILCEKPFVISVKEAEEALKIVEASKVFCLEALMYRFHPLIHKLQTLINDEKVIGDIKLFNATYTANIVEKANPTAGGAIRNLGCYPVSLIRLLAKSEPTEVLGLGRMNTSVPNDSQASAILKFENDLMAVVSTADDIEMCWQFEVFGNKGHLKVVSNPWLPECDHNKIVIQSHDEASLQEINVAADKPLYTYQIDSLSQKILTNVFDMHVEEQSWRHTLGNIAVLEKWGEQVRGANPAMMLSESARLVANN